MGYLLPINSIQSQQYANRMLLDPYNFATVNRVEPVKLESDFLKAFEDVVDSKLEKSGGDKEHTDSSSADAAYNPYIFPNPVNLSPAIAQIVGKGMSVNTYV